MENNKSKIQQLYTPDELINYSIKQHLSFINGWLNNADVITQTEETDILKGTVAPILWLNNEQISEDAILNDRANYLIVGPPGVGKTVLIKRLLQRVLIDPARDKYGFPILIKARQLTSSSLIDEIKIILGITHLETREAFKLIVENQILIFIDGLDEIPFEVSRGIVKELSDLYKYSNKSRVIATSRQLVSLPRCKYCEIHPFNTQQLLDLLSLNLPQKEITNLFDQIQRLGIPATPLLIRIAFLIFREQGQLPQKKVLFYKYWIDLCLSEWDKIRMIKRKSKLSKINISNKYFILTYIAFDLSVEHQSILFSHSLILASLSKIQKRLELRTEDLGVILDEIIVTTGLIIQTGSNSFQFAHKAIQEYLAADYLVKLPYAPYNDLIKRIPSILALCVLISSDPVLYFTIVLDSISFSNDNEVAVYNFLLSLFDQAERHEIELFYKITNSEKIENTLPPELNELIKTAYNIALPESGLDFGTMNI